MATAVLVQDINPAVGSPGAGIKGPIITSNHAAYFFANDGKHGSQLWRTDGTSSGTMAISSLPANAAPDELTLVGQTLYFRSNTLGQLWESNGTVAGTVKLADLKASDLSTVGNHLAFTADDGVHGSQPWKSDGTPAGTTMIVDIRAYAHAKSWGPTSSYVDVNGEAYFVADDGLHGTELWKSDGTSAGTMMVVDLTPGANGSTISNLVGFGGALLFSFGPLQPGAPTSTYRSDGTAAGTVAIGGPELGSPTVVAGKLYFDSNGLYRMDTPTSKPVQLGTAYNSDYVNQNFAPDYAYFNGSVFLVNDRLTTAVDFSGNVTQFDYNSLWKVDSGSTSAVQFKPEVQGYNVGPYVVSGGTLYFTANGFPNGTEIFQTDGTASGTVLTADINPGPDSSNPSLLTDLDGHLLFVADDGVHGQELMTLASSAPTATAPILDPIADQSANATLPFTLTAALTNPVAGQPVTYSLATGAPAGSTIDPKTGVFSWTPQPNAAPASVTIQATNGSDPTLSDSRTFVISVATNHPPTLAPIPPQLD